MRPYTGATSGAYRRDIDGLRGVAVLAVIGYHAHWPGFAGGYLGVDIFFVISGFVITRLITEQVEAGRFRLAAFFARRFRRLAPALLVVLLACLAPAWWLMLPSSLMEFGRALLAVLWLVPNLHFWRSTGYFNAAGDEHPLLHTWSLGVEEQFYLGFALLMVTLTQLRRRHTNLLLALLFVASLAACELFRREAAVAAFYLLPFRAWELLLGALASCLLEHLDKPSAKPIPDQWRSAASLVGMVGLLACLALFDNSVPHPGLWTLGPTTLTVLVILGGSKPSTVTRLLGWRPLVGIGLVSYSAYLWHHPLFAFSELALLRMPAGWESVGVVTLTFALAALSWRFVEQPARQATQSMIKVIGWALAGALVVAGFAVWALAHGGAPERLPENARLLLAAADDRNPHQSSCLARAEHPLPPSQACRLGAPSARPTLVLMGDSHADALFMEVDDALRSRGRAGLFIAHNGCAPVPNLRRSDMGRKSPCEEFFSSAYSLLKAHPELATIIIAARWSAYANDERFDNLEGGLDNGPRMPLDTTLMPLSASPTGPTGSRPERVIASYREGLLSLRALQRQIVLVDPIPEVGRHLPNWLALQQMRGKGSEEDFSTPLAAYRQRHRAVLPLFDTLMADWQGGALLRIRTEPLFCDGSPSARCLAQQGGVPLYYDDNHLNRKGAKRVVDAIFAALQLQPAP